MAFEMHQRETEGVILLSLSGRIVMGPELSVFQEHMEASLAASKNRLIVNLVNVPSIDSTGLGVLVATQSAFKNAGGAMKLLHLRKRHLDLLVLMKLASFFESFDDEQAAVDSFFPDRAVRRFDILEFVREQEATHPPLALDVEESENVRAATGSGDSERG